MNRSIGLKRTATSDDQRRQITDQASIGSPQGVSEPRTLPAIGIGTGLWISPAGLVILLAGSHVDEVIAWPGRFGLTSERIASVYRQFGERLPVEGRARHHIIRAVVFTGWIRLRQQRNYWSATVDRLDARRKTLQAFFHTLHQAGDIGRHEEIRIYCVESEELVTLDLHQLLDHFVPAEGPVLKPGCTEETEDLPPGSAPIGLELARQPGAARPG